MRTRLVLATLLASAAAAAQTPPAELGQRYIPAPWWMREPVIASLGSVRTEVPANRASFGAGFSEVDRTAAQAQRKVAARVQALDSALRALGGDRVRLTTTFSTRPIYEQYRDKEGRIVQNTAPDKIERYEVAANLNLEVRDMDALEGAYARVLAASPTSVGPVGFRLEPDNALKTYLANEAVKDAARRARDAAAAAGARLGPAKIVDPSGGVCQTQVLAGWPSYVGGTQPTDIETTGARAYAPPPPPPPAPPAAPEQAESTKLRVTLQPPRQPLQQEACVIYALLQ